MKIRQTILSLLMTSALVTAGCANAQNSTDISSSNTDSQTEDADSSGGTGSQSKDADNTVRMNGTDGSDEDTGGNTESTASDPGSRVSASDLFSDRDLKNDYDVNGSAAINLTGNSAQCNSNAVNISDGRITITDEGTYILSGTLQDGMIIVDADKSDKVQLVLNGAEISSSNSAAVYVRQADKVFLTAAADTENSLSNGGAYEAIDENKIDAVIFSKEDLTLNGAGSLNIRAAAGHGVVSKDSLVLTGGSYDITAQNHGLSGKDDVCIAGGNYKITAGKDGIHAENTEDSSLGFVYIANGKFDITSEGDGISSAYFGQIEGGSFKILAGGGYSSAASQTEQNFETKQPIQTIKSVQNTQTASAMLYEQADASANTDTASTKGIKAGGNLWIDNGTFEIDSADDALHTNNSIIISDGSYQIASGDDGIHADDSTDISGGNIKISQSYEGIEGKAIDISGGDISLISDDDGLNAAGGTDSSGFGAHRDSFASAEGVSIAISGGTINVTASGDGIDSNGDLTISGGQTFVSGPSGSGNGSLDYNGEASITGGIFAASGSMGMVQNFGSSSTQGAMLIQTDTGAKGDDISLKDADGNVLVSWQAQTAYGGVIISCPQLKQGNTYTLTAGDSSSQIEMTSLIYGQGSGAGKGSGGMGGKRAPGGTGGGRMPKGTDGEKIPRGTDGEGIPEDIGGRNGGTDNTQ